MFYNDFKERLFRNIYLSDDSILAWLDKNVNTDLGPCRGSGVFLRENQEWKIQQYVLSMSIPNENVKEILLLKKVKDSLFLKSFNK